ncbi:Cytochrome c oxidase subunit IV [Bowdeniella nasicola]|uniref:cytochrome-c oxidase n=1 Tax=Bowdeniella nasicola TaxID=208480 RepID=A0A1H3WDC9_9ACTO|nr:cytochrome c oxidase subunit 4 [Bowdeniella nasicola]SDZ84342.1 Cytochrome c oxidase subunit IV [Bowdeniella nasicola]
MEQNKVLLSEQLAKPDGYSNEAKPLRVEMLMFFLGIFFFGPVAIGYMIVANMEPVGTTAFLLLAGMCVLVGGYLWILGRRIDKRPEDDPYGEIAEREGQLGEFSPHSWWPLVLGIATTLVFAGLAIGRWVVVIGVAVAIIGLVGQLFEFSRGIHAH